MFKGSPKPSELKFGNEVLILTSTDDTTPANLRRSHYFPTAIYAGRDETGNRVFFGLHGGGVSRYEQSPLSPELVKSEVTNDFWLYKVTETPIDLGTSEEREIARFVRRHTSRGLTALAA